jgi:predicted phage tail protein
MTQVLTIRGAGGGGKSGGNSARVPVEAKDSLRSSSFAHVLDLLCEGEIEGLVNGLQSVYLDGTPIENADGTTNFSGVTVATVNGTQAQSYLPGFTGTESEVSVNTEVTAAVSVTKTITNALIDAVRVRVAIPGLSQQNTTTGDLTGTSVRIAIDIQSNGGGFVAQNIGFDWVSSLTPATLPAIGLKIETQWAYQAPVKAGRGYTVMGTVGFSVQYRQVGAGTWTTLKADAFTSAQRFTGRQNPAALFTLSRFYTITGLPELLYEARVVLDSGVGTVAMKSFQILTAVPYDDITGKTTSTYQRSYRRELIGSPPWDVRVRRITADSGSVALRNKTYFDSYAELIDQKFSYPNSALAGLSIDAAQFSSIPTRGYDVKLLRVKIPSNYNPTTRVYTGIWDGTFVVAWTDNPAWCFYNLLTNTRYGLGQFLPAAQVDKWALYTIGQYCDGLVPDQLGHEEPRFTCNLYLQTPAEAFQVLVSMASIFRGMAYWAAGSITAVQDAPADPVFLFTEANVEGGLFTYSGSAKQARHTVALVSWNDPDDGYKLKPEYVEDVAGIARYGVVQTSVVAVGCASRGQAHRVGEWLLYSEQHETEVVTYRCGHDGTYLRPGHLFAVQDQHRAGIRYGGRVVASTVSSLTIDQTVTIVSGQTYTVQVVLPDGTLATKTVTNAPGPTTVLTVSVNFVVLPLVAAVWILTSSALAPRLYRALMITEVARQTYEVTGLAHNPSKFDFIERDLLLETPALSTLTTVPTAPQNLVISESLAISAGTVIVVVELTWEPVVTASRYRIEYRRDSGNYVSLPEVRTTSAEIRNALPGYYEVRVLATNILSAVSAAATASKQILGKTAPPANVQGFVVARNGDELVFAWQAVPDLDLDYYALRQGLSWEAGVPIGTTTGTQLTVRTNIGGTYLMKAVDTSGHASLTPAAIVIGAHTDINVVVTANDAPTWLGVTNQTAASGAGVTLAGQTPWAALTSPWTSYTDSWIKTGNPYSTGTYETVPIDLGVVMTSRVEILPTLEQLSIAGTWADFINPWITYTDPWTGTPGLTRASYEMALSQDGSSYAAYQTYQPGHYLARAYKFRITLSTVDGNYVPLLTAFLVTIDVPDRVVHFEDQATDAGGTTLVFSPAFVNVQTVTGTIQAGAIGDTFRVTGKTNTQATITVYDSAGVAKAGLVDIDVFGYGAL